MSLRFEWDDGKAENNLRKHGVSFEEATTVFENAPLAVFFDPDHSAGEERYIAVGFCDRSRVLLVVHCENGKGTVVRIISARRATRREARSAFGGDLP